jgi:hypothetical protein
MKEIWIEREWQLQANKKAEKCYKIATLGTERAASCRVMHCGNCVLTTVNRGYLSQFLVGKRVRLLCYFSYLM